MAWFFLQSGWDSFKKQKAISQLDGYSLRVLANNTGLLFAGDNLDSGTLRYLIGLDLIHVELFPVEPGKKEKVTWGHYLTKEGRKFLARRLGRRDLYPNIFCDMLRIRYWKGNESRWDGKKLQFVKHYAIEWQKCWNVYLECLKKEDPAVNSENDLGPTEKYLTTNSFDIVVEKLVKPWMLKLGLKDRGGLA